MFVLQVGGSSMCTAEYTGGCSSFLLSMQTILVIARVFTGDLP